MKTFITLLLTVGTIAVSLAQNELTYDKNRRLEWDSFKGQPDMNSWASAMTATLIKLNMTSNSKGVRVTVECVFVPSKSWVKPDHKDYVLLLHENGHFQLRELYARMLRKELKELKINSKNAGRKIKRLYAKYHKKASRTNRKYDKQTNFSRNKNAQTKWYAYINQELKRYESHAGTTLFLNF